MPEPNAEHNTSHLPIDPDVKIPDAIRKRAAAVDALYQQLPVPPEPAAQTDSPVPQTAASETSPPPSPPPPADPSPAFPEPQLPLEPVNWEERYNRMKGRFEAAERQNADMQDQMAQLGEELMQAQHALQGQRPPQQLRQHFLTDDDFKNFGPEMIDLAQRAARQVMTPEMQRLQEENDQLRQNLARTVKQTLDQALDYAVPNWREVNANERFHHWLRLPDLYSSRIRKQLLDEAVQAADARRVIGFFQGFLQEEAATGHVAPAVPVSAPAPPPREPAIPLASLAAPGRVRPANGGEPIVPPERPIYSRADILRLSRDYQRGAYRGREAEYQRISADIVAAGNEGRIRG